MAEPFILIPGRTSRQGTSLNEGKYTDEYKDEIGTLQISADDMQRLGIADGDRVRLWNDIGDVTVPCKTALGTSFRPVFSSSVMATSHAA